MPFSGKKTKINSFDNQQVNFKQVYYSSKLREVGRKVLVACDFATMQSGEFAGGLDFFLKSIVPVCLQGPESEETAWLISKNLKTAFDSQFIHRINYPDLLSFISKNYPFVFMDVFFENVSDDVYYRCAFSVDFESHQNPVNNLLEEDLIEWCNIDPANRCKTIVYEIQMTAIKDEGSLVFKPLLYQIFKKSSDIKSVLEQLQYNIFPKFYSCSIEEMQEKMLCLIQEMFNHENSDVQDWAKQQYSKIKEEISFERERDTERNRIRYESFE